MNEGRQVPGHRWHAVFPFLWLVTGGFIAVLILVWNTGSVAGQNTGPKPGPSEPTTKGQVPSKGKQTPPGSSPVTQQPDAPPAPGGKASGEPRIQRPTELPGQGARPEGGPRPLDPVAPPAATTPPAPVVQPLDQVRLPRPAEGGQNQGEEPAPAREDMSWVGVVVFLLITVPGTLILLLVILRGNKAKRREFTSR